MIKKKEVLEKKVEDTKEVNKKLKADIKDVIVENDDLNK